MNISFIKKQIRKIQGVLIKYISPLVRFFSRNPDENIAESCYVLGRGRSLDQFKKSNIPLADCFLPNFDDKTVAALGVQHILDKNLTIVANCEERIIIKYLWYRLKFRNVYTVMFKEQPDIWKDRCRDQGCLEIYGLSVLFLPPNLGVDFTANLRNTGLISIHLAASTHKKILLYGFDFYQADYVGGGYSVSKLTKMQEQKHSDSGVELIRLFYKVVDYWPDVEFEIFTFAFLKESRPNLTIYNVNKNT
tara:strand:+ start:566 stop:1312 length:747 start_codon:yes stop_codon:yes gene_type:complete